MVPTYPYLSDPTLPFSSFKLLTVTSLHTPWLQIQMLGYIDHTLRIIQAVKHAGRAISAGREIKEEIEFSGGQGKAEEFAKSAYAFGWLSKWMLALGKH